MPKILIFTYLAAAILIGFSTLLEMPQRIAVLCLAGLVLALPKIWQRLRDYQVGRHQTCQQSTKNQAEKQTIDHQEQQEKEQRKILESALNSDMSITPGMLPPLIAQGLELLRCVVTENYLNLRHRRLTLGENSIDWQVELLKLAEKEFNQEFPHHVPLTRAQTIQAMNSYLNYLMAQSNLDNLEPESKVA